MAHRNTEGITREHLLEAIRRIDDGEADAFDESRINDVIHNGRTYPPKAVVGIAASILTGQAFGPDEFSGAIAAKYHRILTANGFEISTRAGHATAGAWIFQGNPEKFAIDDYLSRYQFIYWHTPILGRRMSIGDRCFIWRAGPDAGVVAVGRIEELPCKAADVQFPECLGADLWWKELGSDQGTKTGIRVEDVRLDKDSGFIPKTVLKSHPLLSDASIIRSPQGTVFRLDEEEADALERIWGLQRSTDSGSSAGETEGDVRLRLHFARERSRALIAAKKNDFEARHEGRVFCELCGFSFVEYYPRTLGHGFIEVHHIEPLASRASPRRTVLSDLILVCSNCHRMIHRTGDAEANLRLLREHFAGRVSIRKEASR